MWVADLSRAPADVDALLSAEDLGRAAKMRDPEARRRWIASRGLVRALLGEWVSADPSTLVFEIGRYGKPRLKLAGPTFNVSHSGRLAVCAICEDQEVGVDVEVSDRGSGRRDDVAVARRVLGESVAGELSALSGEERAVAFLKAWVAHEAVVKCLGVGIGHAEVAARPWVSEIDVGQGAYAALAVAGGPADVVLHAAWGWERARGGTRAARP